MSKIGIVTVLYNSEKVLKDFFETLELQSYRDFTLYVIDNSSADNSLDIASELARKVSFETKIIAEPENWGVAKGNNIGIKEAIKDNCEYILLSNNDVVLEPDTIGNLLKEMTNNGLDMAVSKIFYHEKPDLIWSYGGTYHPFKGTTVQFGMMMPDKESTPEIRECDYSPTCFMLISARVFSKIGLMDEKYFVYYDDTDFVWRAVKKGGLKLGAVPNSRLWHKESISTGGHRSDFGIYYLNRNKRYFVGKNYKGLRKYITLAYITIYRNVIYPVKWGRDKLELMRKANKDGLKMLKGE